MGPCVGIIANPAASHDIRRLSGHSSIVDNLEKARILRRALLGLQAVGVAEALAMPDQYGLALAAASAAEITIAVRLVDMVSERNETDSTRAAERMAADGCACIITLGGDGTNRAVAKGCGAVPLLAISTGTNNVIPEPIEGTIAGMAAGLFACGLIPEGVSARPTKRLEVLEDGALIDIALVDVAASSSLFLGARAILDTSTITGLWLTQARPGSIGLAAIGAGANPLDPGASGALALDIAGPDDVEPFERVLAPIAPGKVTWVGVRACRRLEIGEPAPVTTLPCVLALDGERALRAPAGGRAVTIRATWNGPKLLDARAIFAYAASHGLFSRRATG